MEDYNTELRIQLETLKKNYDKNSAIGVNNQKQYECKENKKNR